VPIHVQQAELDLVLREGHTIVEWVDFPNARYEAVEGDREIVEGVSVLATPGHTPGHQSVTVRTGDGLVLIVGQASQDARSFATGDADATIRRLRELNADRVHFSHDRAVLRRRR
jgi:glyoxylase-like metal-dependent hydrolase (beta-lactamase superfamily II)